MVSMATEDANSNSSVIPKAESIQDGFTPSSASSPALEQEESVSAELTTDPPPVPKRKGGRKPIYATSEERKQRNRQAQAAFRERRTEYIKQLETTIQHQEETIHTLQQSHRSAADECLMLRYKNSLLERILLEKGIDVQAELRLKASPNLRPIRHGSSATGQPSPMQRAILNRQQHARQRPSLTSPIQTQTPASQQSSPSALRSPAFSMHGGLTSPTSDLQGQQQQSAPQQQQQQQHQPQQRPMSQQLQQNPYANQARPHMRASSANFGSQSFNPVSRPQPSGQMQPNFYQSPFQKHYDQLDQEYDAQTDMLDDGDGDGDDVEADSFIPNFRLPPSGGGMTGGMQISPPTTTSVTSNGGGGTQTVPFDFDPMLDADPFGLTASMNIPNTFNFTGHGRR